MYQYAYISVATTGLFGTKCTEHREIIDGGARHGYRYAGCLPTNMDAYGGVREIDLIFELEN